MLARNELTHIGYWIELWFSGVFSGYKMEILTRNELKQGFQRAQRNSIELNKNPD